MLIYSLFAPACHVAMRPFYRRVFISNFEKIPLDAPVILAVNHPTGFVDPLVLSAYVKKEMWHMTRGDLFRKPWAAALMRSCNMFPVYRFREGFEDTRRNNEVFEYCTQKLAENAILTIYVEGNSAHEKRLRPLQKARRGSLFRLLKKTNSPIYRSCPSAQTILMPIGRVRNSCSRRASRFLWPIFLKNINRTRPRQPMN